MVWYLVAGGDLINIFRFAGWLTTQEEKGENFDLYGQLYQLLLAYKTIQEKRSCEHLHTPDYNIIDGDMNNFYEEADKSHNKKAYASCSRNPCKL